MIKVSVIISAYNMEQYIARCIESICDQTLKEIEIIVVNDGSNDNTLNIVEQLYKTDSRIKIVNKENGGISSARNYGLDYANGKYVLFIDADDWIDRYTCENMYNYAIKNDCDIVMCNANLYYDNDICKPMNEIGLSNHTMKDLLNELIIGNMLPAIWNKLIKRDLFKTHDIKFPIGISMGEDFYVVTQLIFYSKKIAKIDEAHIYYFQRKHGITRQFNNKSYDIIKAINLIELFLEEKNIKHNYNDEIEFCKFMHVFKYRVCEFPKKCEVHRKLYDYSKENIKSLKQNILIAEYMKKCSLKEKLIIKLYYFNYNLGLFFSNLIEM